MKSEKNFMELFKDEVLKNIPTEILKEELLRRGMSKEELRKRGIKI